MIQAFKKRIYGPVIQAWCKNYFKKPRKYQYADIKGLVLPGVFFPHFTLSTGILIDYIKKQDLSGKRVLELGCGTGFISVAAAQGGAKVLASDINVTALENTQLNAKKNGVELETIESNLFQKIENKSFDYIIINPPYYPQEPVDISENAWYCGEDFEYFKSLFSQVGQYICPNTEAVMILSEDCEVQKIIAIARSEEIGFEEINRTKKKGEINMIFRITEL